MIFFLKSTLTILIRAICISIFAWQFYLLTRNYQEFNVRKEVIHYIPNEIEVPEFHIHIPYQFALSPVILRTKYRSRFDEICGYFSDKKDCDGHLTNPVLFSKLFGPYLLLSDIANYSYAPEMLIRQLHLTGLADPLKTGECKLISRASASSLVLILQCLDSSGAPLKLSRSRAVVYNGNYLLAFKLNATVMLLNLIYPEKALVEDDSFYAYSSLTPGKQISHGIRFTKHTENLLPAPYKTMCKDYDRRQTFEDCLNTHSIKQTGMLFPGTTVSLEKYRESSEMHFNSIMFQYDNGTLRKIYEQCKSLVTQPICSSVRYSFKMSTASEDVAKGKENLAILSTVSSEPDSITTSKPEFPLFDYLILSGSLISSWFGISIMGQLLVASNLFCIAIERKSTVVSDEQIEGPEL